MISRRNIRVKVMQTLYTIDAAEDQKDKAKKLLDKHLEQSRQLFVYLLHFITRVARYAEQDSHNRLSKHLPTQQDLNVNIKIAGNELMWKILEDPSFQKACSDIKPQQWDNSSLIRKTYLQLAEAPVYKEYIALQERNKKSEKNILEYIFTDLMLASDDFTSEIEDIFIHWDDDAEMMSQLVLNFLQKPAQCNFQDMIGAEKRKFANDLLDAVINKEAYCMELIKPKLKNWDAERIAVLDMILMRMGVCEFLYFETIPTKVTINEYIDLAKAYSTPQSGHFVNGILDNIHKDLLAQDKLHKTSYKKP
ncbi:transcription antitermination factor NusB [Agriterribacter sp.]|uniref:transcription antitermination factor NusB n=1 Tax=Agriterribacter sp. TaxID=2821509 RepID=UPI002BADA60D|nr:transcription antitermination factor NusB [Agriterribacter sp.]HRO46637.1 transcription antitermination factor NusB [Agriterribacter sp.]HRQ17297.1 transcription antitermination factor NusB [Agriterribacter sp.]